MAQNQPVPEEPAERSEKYAPGRLSVRGDRSKSRARHPVAVGNGDENDIGFDIVTTPEYPPSYALDNIVTVAATDHYR